MLISLAGLALVCAAGVIRAAEPAVEAVLKADRARLSAMMAGDGVALGQRLCERAPGLPLLLMSGREHAGARSLAAAGKAVFLAKPFFPGQLDERIATLLGAIA